MRPLGTKEYDHDRPTGLTCSTFRFPKRSPWQRAREPQMNTQVFVRRAKNVLCARGKAAPCFTEEIARGRYSEFTVSTRYHLRVRSSGPVVPWRG